MDHIELDLVDLDVLGRWMDEQGLPAGPVEALTPLGGGTQNVMVRFRRAGRDYVLRRGPRHLRPDTNDVLRREATVLAALDGTDVPHPSPIAVCPDAGVMGGAVFYLMEPVEGFNPTVELPPLHAADAAVRHEMGPQAAAAVAALGEVDHVAVGLGEVGRPEGFLERQVERWLAHLASYTQLEGYPGPDIPGVDRVAAWLEENRPTTARPGILHGDYHLANLLYRVDGPQVAAIVDWEMCTVGDPLLDLGWLVATWPGPDAGAAGSTGPLVAAGGLPGPGELVARYAERSTRDLSAVDWYVVLACFKLGIVLEGTHARACAGKAPTATGDLLHAMTLGLFARAHGIIAGRSPRRGTRRP
ncbi:MAG: phosphotransferase family protein [Acidimicrobiales bacterium]|nr:phosphotransferase family protein [Acidimicrobiales bacterium]